jgi:hypothetical protein
LQRAFGSYLARDQRKETEKSTQEKSRVDRWFEKYLVSDYLCSLLISLLLPSRRLEVFDYDTYLLGLTPA